MAVISELRKRVAQLQDLKEQVWRQIDAEQPNPALVDAVQKARQELYKDTAVGSNTGVPKRISLLPVYKLQHAFVSYDGYSIRSFGPGVCGRDVLLPATSRTWWTTIFDFHSKRHTYRETPRRGRNTKKKRKVLKQKRRFRKGIPLCVRDGWVPDDVEYERRKANETVPVPWLVSSVKTDGLQVKVLLATVVKAERDNAVAGEGAGAPLPQCDVKDPLPSGVAKLREKGYAMNNVFDARKHRRGVFADVLPIPPSSRDSYHCIGVDPGQINIATVVRRQALLSRCLGGSPRTCSTQSKRKILPLVLRRNATVTSPWRDFRKSKKPPDARGPTRLHWIGCPSFLPRNPADAKDTPSPFASLCSR